MVISSADFDASPYISVLRMIFTLQIPLAVYYSLRCLYILDLEFYRLHTSLFEGSWTRIPDYCVISRIQSLMKSFLRKLHLRGCVSQFADNCV
jgi:hypothetical protein